MKYRRTFPRPSMPNFTLIEALVVVIVCGVLVAVVLFATGVIEDPSNDGPEWDSTPPSTTVTTTTTPVALLTCEQLDNVGYDGLASCIDPNGNVVGPGQ